MSQNEDNTMKELMDLRRKAELGVFMSKDEELFLGKVMYDGSPWSYPKEPGGQEYSDASEYPARTESQIRNADIAKTTLYESNKKLVYNKANAYFMHYHQHVPIDECIMNGFQGLARALKKYDYRKGFKFSTYAIWWIRRDIHRGSNGMARVVNVPDADIKKFTDVDKEMAMGIPMEDALQHHGITKKTYLMIQNADAFYTSLDTTLSDDGEGTLMDILPSDNLDVDVDAAPDPSLLIENEQMMRDLALSIARLPEQQRTLISMLYSPDTRQRGKRQVSDASVRAAMGLSKHDYDILKKDALDMLAVSMGNWRK